jgi:hypothetical protein
MDKIILKLIEFQTQVKILHWQTNSYARHKAYDKIYNKLGDLIDDFVEVYQGKYLKLEIKTSKLEIKNLDVIQLNDYIGEFISVLQNEVPSKLEKNDTDLLNIRDEILGTVHRLKYFCTLK